VNLGTDLLDFIKLSVFLGFFVPGGGEDGLLLKRLMSF